MPAAKKAAAKPPAKETAAKKTTKPTRKATPAKPSQPTDSMTMIRVGSHDYPMHSVAQCRTCQSPHRRMIEAEILKARAYAHIARSLETMPVGDMPHPSSEAISNHVTSGHMPSPATVRRRIVDRRAAALGHKIMGEDSLVDYVVVNEMILQQGFERLMNGEIEVSVSDLLSAINTQQKIEALSDTGFDVEAMQQVLIQYLEIASNFIPDEMQAAYGAALNRNPVIQAIAAKQAGQVVDQDGAPVQ